MAQIHRHLLIALAASLVLLPALQARSAPAAQGEVRAEEGSDSTSDNALRKRMREALRAQEGSESTSDSASMKRMREALKRMSQKKKRQPAAVDGGTFGTDAGTSGSPDGGVPPDGGRPARLPGAVDGGAGGRAIDGGAVKPAVDGGVARSAVDGGAVKTAVDGGVARSAVDGGALVAASDGGVAAPASSDGGAFRVVEAHTDVAPGAMLRITVDASPLVGARSFAERRGGQIYLPIHDVGVKLGWKVEVDAVKRTVTVERLGVFAVWNASTGEVTENSIPILLTTRSPEILFSPVPQDLMVPLEVATALLDAAVVVNEAAQEVQIRAARGPELSIVDRPRTAFELYRASYAYNLYWLNNTGNQSLSLNSDGRFTDGLFNGSVNFSRSPVDRFVDYRYGQLAWERKDGLRIVGGDVQTGTDLSFLASQMRGVSVRYPGGPGYVNAFVGAARSDVPIGETTAAWDTFIVGSYYSWPTRHGTARLSAVALEKDKKSFRLQANGGAMYLVGPTREGAMFTANAGVESTTHVARVDVGLGAFGGLQPDGTRVSGAAEVIDASDSWSVSERVTVVSRLARIGPNFIAPQQTGFLRPMNLAAAGVNWRPPMDWVSTSLNAQVQTTPDFASVLSGSATGVLALTPGGQWPAFVLSHTQGIAAGVGRTAFSYANATRDFRKWTGQVTYARTQVGTAPASNLLTLGARIELPRQYRLNLVQSFAGIESHSGSADVSTPPLWNDRVVGTAGVGYAYSSGTFHPMGRLGVTARLPLNQQLGAFFQYSVSGPQFTLEVRGPLYELPRTRAHMSGGGEADESGSLSGRVYQDTNLNGRFDEGVDRPQIGVQVTVDGTYFTVSDGDGRYKVREIRAGEHTVLLDLLSVRADLTILGDSTVTMTLPPGRDAALDFRLVKTGRMRGIVWIDRDGDGQLGEADEGVPDVRVVIGNDKDTLTDLNGDYVIGDLPAGAHPVLVDEKTLPPELELISGAEQVEIHPGIEVTGVNFRVRQREKPVEIIEFPPENQ